MQARAPSGRDRSSPSSRAISAIERNRIVVEIGSSIAIEASPKAPPSAPEAAAAALCAPLAALAGDRLSIVRRAKRSAILQRALAGARDRLARRRGQGAPQRLDLAAEQVGRARREAVAFEAARREMKLAELFARQARRHHGIAHHGASRLRRSGRLAAVGLCRPRYRALRRPAKGLYVRKKTMTARLNSPAAAQ